MALDFPTSPTNGQVFGAYTYDSTAGAWRSSALYSLGVATGGTTNQFLTKIDSSNYNTQWSTTLGVANGGTGATTLTSGAYLKGAGTSAVTAQAGIPGGDITSGTVAEAYGGTGSALGAGLMPVVPTSVVVAAGSASVSAKGFMTFTNATNVNVNGVFTSAFKNYKILFELESANPPGSSIRLRASGVDASGATDYAWYGYRAISWSGAAGLNGTTGGTSWIVWDTVGTATLDSMIMDIMLPAEAKRTKMISTGYIFSGGNIGTSYYSGHHKLTTSYNSFSFINSTAFNGTMQVLGYNS